MTGAKSRDGFIDPSIAAEHSSDSRVKSTCSCVPPLDQPADRIAHLKGVLRNEPEPLVVVTQLLRLCRDEHRTLWEHHADPRCRSRVAELTARTSESLPSPGSEARLSASVRRALAMALTALPNIPIVVVAHALAELVDVHYGATFTGWYRHRSPYMPAVDDPIPLDSPDLRTLTDVAPTAPPWRLANRLDETRRVRLAGAWATQFRVVFDYSAFDALAGLISTDTVIATCHPNRDLTEFALPADRRTPAFPVGPIDVMAQRERVQQVLAQAVDAGAAIAVLPELAVTNELAHELEHWVREPGPLRVLVAGSFHYTDPTDPSRRANRALTWVRGHPAPLLHDKHSPADLPAVEDITPTGWPELRVHVTADGWHLVIAICRDLLNPHAVHALTEAGANLVLAPSMSETMVAFGGPVAQLVGATQAIVAVANNPAEWSAPDQPDGSKRPARAIFGHPGFGQQTRQVQAPNADSGVALLSVRTGHLSWHPHTNPSASPNGTPSTATDAPPPAWLIRLPHTTPPTAQRPSTVTLRAAAVLVLLTDGPEGPNVLLTGRSPDLTHYAGQLVFPGGAADPGDRGLVDTALREASEEIGLDPSSVHVIGTLPAFALADSGFLVSPVMAWSHEPRFLHPANQAEVTTIRAIPLIGNRVDADISPASAEETNVGVMTAAVLDMLRAHLTSPGS